MVLGVVFSLLGIGMLVALMFNIAILAMPLFVAVAAGRFAYDTGAGALSAIAVGLAVAIAFTAPAVFAGYHLVFGLSHIGGAHGLWQQIFATIGSVAIGMAALMRLATPVIPPAPPTPPA